MLNIETMQRAAGRAKWAASALIALGLVACGGEPIDEGNQGDNSSSVSSSSSTQTSSSNSQAQSSSSSVDTTPQAVLMYAINVGGNQAVTGPHGVSFVADNGFRTGGDLANTPNQIAGTNYDSLYQTEAWGEFTYNLPVENGNYDILLNMAEIYWDNTGQRVFDVTVEGQVVIDDLDILAHAAKFEAYDREILNVSVTDGQLNINFKASTDAAKLSGLMVQTAAGGFDGNFGSSSSSSQQQSSSSSSQQMSSSSSSYNAVFEGSQDWKDVCAGCHGTFDEGLVSTGFKPINLSNVVGKYNESQLANYIYNQMPPTQPKENCGVQCGQDVAAFLLEVYANGGTEGGGINEDNLTGAELYKTKGCLGCHGNNGLQKGSEIPFDNHTLASLQKAINDYMPLNTEDRGDDTWMNCIGECARKVAEYVWTLRPVVSCDSGDNLLPRRVRVLSKFEYINTINDLFGRNDAESLASAIGNDTEIRGFDNNAKSNSITIARMNSYWTTAGGIAEVASVNGWLNTNQCSQQNAGVGYCFVEKFGRLAFRRNLTNEEKTEYADLFALGSNSEEGARIVVQTMLVSPNFLYRTELGQNGRLTQFEVATLLAYTFWGSTPDAALLDKAASNSLSNVTQIKATVAQMLTDERAQKQFVHFGRQWLHVDSVVGLDRDPQLFPAFTNSVAQAMDQEVEMFLQEILLKDGYNMSDFFVSGFTFANSVLANFYGIGGVSGNNMQKVLTMPGDHRGGVLSLGAILARNSKFEESHPIHRGLLVRRNLLCQQFPTPPPNVGEIEPFDRSKPTRERFRAHTEQDGCINCHQYIDEIGFASLNFDAVGQYRNTELNGAAVDASGSISGLVKMTGSDSYNFNNLQDLSDILAGDGLMPTSSCLAEQFQRMMDGVAEPDSCTVESTVARWDPQTSSIKDLWVEIVASQVFTQRQ